ncbi:hypothetical protein IT403_03425 [Candidatus Nomurabacteria bacterium]|nr:hypothetical protein [Candidatus Nomurabacteria bacterium]
MQSVFQKVSYVFFLVLILVSTVAVSRVSAATGTIDATDYTAQFTEDGSDVLFRTTNGTAISVSDSAITGYAWGENAGWINFAPTNGGVTNTTGGVLGGYAWGENAGWINFAPTNGGVTINTSTGQFSGYAWSEVFGWLKFDCGAGACVKTSWTPTSTPPPTTPPGGVIIIPPTPTCANTPSLCVPTPATCATNPSLCVPITPIDPPVTPPVDPTLPPTSPISNPPVISNNPPSNPTNPTSQSQTPSPGLDVLNAAAQTLNQGVTFVSTSFGSLVEKAQSGVKTKAGQLVTTILGTIGLLGSLFSIPESVWRSFFSFFALRRRKPWGVVYDSVTKVPLDPVYVMLQDMQGNEVASSITDIDGRYGFLVAPGTYTISAGKTNYIFPSKKLASKTTDELYEDLYFGETITVDQADSAITKNIPMDAVQFDWNEQEKLNKGFMRFYHKRDVIIADIADIVFFAGFAFTSFAFFVVPGLLNAGILFLYIVMFVLKETGLRPRPHGIVKEKATGAPLPYAIVRVYVASLNKEIMRKVTDAEGRYFCLVTPGTYYMTIEKKNPDGTYTLISNTPTMTLKNGYISKTLEV